MERGWQSGAEAPDDDDSESKLKKRSSSYEKRDLSSDRQPKRFSLENMFVTEKVDVEKQEKKLEDMFDTSNNESKVEDSNDDNDEKQTGSDEDSSSENSLANNTETHETPIEVLDNEEQLSILETVAQQRTEDIQEELSASEPNSVDEIEALAGATFTESLLHKLADAEKVDDELIDEAMDEALEVLNIESISTIDATNEESPEANEIEATEATDRVEDDSDGGTLPSATIAASTAVGGATVVGVSSGGAAGVPPSGVSGGSGRGGNGSNGVSAPGGGFAAGAASSVAAKTGYATGVPGSAIMPASLRASERTEHRHSHIPHVLVGGIVGYLIGRRRGRIKTEDRLLPVQEKLESQVKELEEKIFLSEQKVRKLTVENQPMNPINKTSVVEKLNIMNEERQKKPRPERILPLQAEQVTPTTEKADAALSQQAQEIVAKQPEIYHRKAENMKTSELLEIASTIRFENSDVRRMYEQGLVSYGGLMNIVKEFLAKGNIEKALFENIKKQETNKTPLTPELLKEVQEIPNPETLGHQPQPLNKPGVESLNNLIDQKFGPSKPEIGAYGQSVISSQSDRHKMITSQKIALIAGSVFAVVALGILVGVVLIATP